nr:hypothetical protein GCM10020093_087840 [Planobispora longispora]
MAAGHGGLSEAPEVGDGHTCMPAAAAVKAGGGCQAEASGETGAPGSGGLSSRTGAGGAAASPLIGRLTQGCSGGKAGD